jgi:hypothetical protein
VRYVRPEAEEEERLRVVVAELQAVSILRRARLVVDLRSREETPAGEAGVERERKCG